MPSVDEEKLFRFLIENIDTYGKGEECPEVKHLHSLAVKYQELAFDILNKIYEDFSSTYPVDMPNGHSSSRRRRAYEMTLLWTGFLMGVTFANKEN
jgi:hypothetical protein